MMEIGEENKDWDLAESSKGEKPMGSKWAFTMKYKVNKSLEIYEARLVTTKHIGWFLWYICTDRKDECWESVTFLGYLVWLLSTNI